MAYNLSENLTIQLQLLEPTAANIGAIRKQLEAGLKGINIGSLDTKNFVKANAEVNNLSKTFDKGREKAGSFFDAVEGKARGFAAYTVASTAILKLTGAISQATREAIKYEAELLKISQVTGDSISRTKDLSKSLFDISKQYNVNITKVAQLTRTLTQTGMSFREAAKGAEILARTSLLATFDNLTDTTEGLIAVMQTFNLTVKQSGDVLEKINAVSKAFAVESSDIVDAIRRAGGAFSTANGQIEDLIALFTSVRSTSRESAETIATGFRTIFGRLQRPKTIEYFKQLGIQLETAEGQFIGPLKAIEQISKGLDRLGIKAGSVKFAEVVEQIGGIRQISRVVPLLEQYEKTQKALRIQNDASTQSFKDIEKAQKGLGFQLGQLKQEFGELIAEFVNSTAFQVVAKSLIGFTRTIISLTKAIKPLLPLMAAFAAFKIGRGISQIASGGFSLKSLKDATGFARGGVVPGSGDRDTVPAMLTPGEFVVRKSAVKAYGADRLAKINKYAQGGVAKLTTRKPSISKYYDTDLDQYDVNPIDISLIKRRKEFRDDAKKIWDKAVQEKDPNAYIYKKTKGFAGSGSQTLGPKELDASSSDERRLNKIAGALTELAVKKILGNAAKKLSDKSGPDFQNGNEFFEVKSTLRKVPDEEIVAKAVLGEGIRQNGKLKDGSKQTVKPKITHIRAMSKGGGVGTDTVPALLTPGEFVVNKKSAQAFGYNNLRKINKYASGGTVDGVEVQRFGDGDVVLSKEEKKRRREQYKSDQLGTSLTRGERTGGWQKEIIAKYSKLIAEERAAIQKVYAEKIKTAIAEKKSIAGIVKQKNAAQADSEKALTLGMNRAISDKGSDIAAKQAADKLKKANESLVIIQEDAAKKLKTSFNKFNITLTEMIFQVGTLGATLEAFGININQSALDAGKVKAGGYDMFSRMMGKINPENIEKFSGNVKNAGDALGKLGDKVGGKFGGVIGKAGGFVSKFGDTILKSSSKIVQLAKAANVIGRVIGTIELFGGVIDSLFSVDYKKQKERAVATGDVEGAGNAAVAAYNQEFLRGIPIVGGLLSAMQPLIPGMMSEMDARGRLVKATAEAQASMVKFDKEMKQVSSDLQTAMIENDPGKIQAALGRQEDLISGLGARAEDLKAKAEDAKKQSSAGSVIAGGAGGAVTGAGIGALVGSIVPGIGTGIGAAVGGTIGGIVGAATAFTSSLGKSTAEIVESYQTVGELYEKAAQEQISRMDMFGGQMTSVITKVIMSGGSVEQAFDVFKDKFGQAAFDELFGGIDMDGSAESFELASKKMDAAIENSRTGIQTMETDINKLADAVDNGWTPAWWNLWQGTKNTAKTALAAAEAELKKQKAEQEVMEAQRRNLAQIAQAKKDAELLAQARDRENAALRESLLLMKERIGLFDKLNQGSRNMQLALEDVSAAMSGGLSRQQILDREGIGVSANTLSMSGEEVMRNEQAFNQMYNAVARLGNQRVTGGLLQGKQNIGVLDDLQGQMLSGPLGKEIATIVATAQAESRAGTEGASTEDASLKVTEAIINSLGLEDLENNPKLRAALDKYGKALIEGKEAGTALEELKKEMTEEEAKLIEEVQAKYNEYLQMEQQLQQYKIEQINRHHQLQQKVYDAEMDYLNKRLALSEKVDDALDEGPVGKGRVGFLKQRGEQRRANRMAGIGAARQRSGLPANTRGAEQTTINSLNNLDPKLDTFGETLADLTGQGERLLSTLQDEIAAEQDYLDSLIETAKAQQEYTQALNDAQGDLVRDLVTGTQEEQADTLSTLNAAAYSAMQGSFQGIPEDMKKDIFSVFDKFGDVEIPGLGMTGRDAQRNIAKNELMQNWGVDEGTAEQLASKMVKDRVPIDERMKEMIELQEKKIMELLAIENQLKQALLMGEKANNDRFAMSVDKFAQSVENFKKDVLNAPKGDAEGDAAEAAAQERKKDAEAQDQQRREDQAARDRQMAEETRANEASRGDCDCGPAAKQAVAQQEAAQQETQAEASGSGLSNASQAAASAAGGLIGKFGPQLFKAGKNALPGLMSSLGKGTKGIRDYAAGKAGAAGDFLSKQFKNVTGKFKGGPATNKTPQLFDIFKRVDANKKSVGKFGKDFAQRLGADYGLDPKQMEALFKPSDVKTGKATDKILMEAAKRQKTGVTAGVTRNSNQLYIKSGKGIEGGVLQHELGHVAQNNLAKTNKAGALALRGQSKTMQPMIEEFLSNPKGYEALKGKTKGMYSADFIRNKPDELFTEMMRKVGTDDFNNNPMAQKLFKTYLSEAGIGPKPPTALQQIGSKASGMVDRFKTGAGAAKDYIGGGLKTAKDYLGGKFDAVKGLAGKLPGAGLVSNLVNRGKDAAGFVGSKLGAAGSFLGKGVGKAMPLLGPALGGAFGYMAPTEQSADPDNPYADALSNRNSYANAAFGLLGAGPTTMGDVGAQSSLGWSLGVEQGSMMDKQLGNWSQFATGTMQNLAMGNVAAPLTTAGAMVGQEALALYNDRSNAATAEAKTGQMGQSYVDANAIDNAALAGMTPEEVIKVKELARLKQQKAEKEAAIAADPSIAKESFDENKPVFYDSEGKLVGGYSNESYIKEMEKQIAVLEAEVEKMKSGKEAVAGEEKIREEGGRDSETYKKNYQAAMEANATEEQKQAQEEKVAKQEKAFNDAGLDFKKDEAEQAKDDAKAAADVNDGTEAQKDAASPSGLSGECCERIVSAIDRVVDAINNKATNAEITAKAEDKKEGETEESTAPQSEQAVAGGESGSGSGASGTKIRDLTQEEVDRLSPNMTPNELAPKEEKQSGGIVETAKQVDAQRESLKQRALGLGMNEEQANKMATQAYGSPVVKGGKYSEQERIANRSRINRIGRMRSGNMTVMDRMQLAGNKMLKGNELSAEMQGNVAAGQSMLSNITDGNLAGNVIGGFTGLMNKGAGIGQKALSSIAGGLRGGSTGVGGVSGSIRGMIPAMGQAVPSAPNISGMIPEIGNVPIDANTGGLTPMPQDSKNAAPNIPAQVAAQSRTSNLLGGAQNNGYGESGGGGGQGGGGPIQVNTTGTQEIIVRLPDIQALVNQSITSLIYQTVGETFNNIASKVATNQNFEDLQRTFSEGVTETQTKQVNSSSTIGGK